MGGIFSILGTASRALAVNQNGLAVVSHNTANVNTPGYTRQRQVTAAGAPIQDPRGAIGTGVEQTSIDRVSDELLFRQLVSEGSRGAALDVEVGALAHIEDVLNEQSGNGLAADLSALFDGFDDLTSASVPGAPVEREAVRGAAETLIGTLHRIDERLRTIQSDADAAVVVAVDEINALADRIAALNLDIVRAEVTAPANDLRDTRDQLVRELSKKVGITSFEQETGSLTVMISGGLTLVENGSSRNLVAEADPTHPFDPRFSRVLFDDGAGRRDVTATLREGELGGQLRVRDEIVADAIRDVDAIAFTLADQINVVHAAGIGLDGTVGNFFASPATVEDAARDLALDPSITASADAIAAGTTFDPGDNRNALALAALRDTSTPLFVPGDPPGPATGPDRTLLDQIAVSTARIGTEARAASGAQQAQHQLLNELENRRDAMSGVSLDEEMIDLIRLEAAYQANARVISTVDGLLDNVLALL